MTEAAVQNDPFPPIPRDVSRFLRLSPDPVAVLREPADGHFGYISSLEMIAEAEAQAAAARTGSAR